MRTKLCTNWSANLAGGNTTWDSNLKDSLAISYKICIYQANQKLYSRASIPDKRRVSHANCMWGFADVLLATVKDWDWPKCASTGRWLSEPGDIQTWKDCPPTKQNQLRHTWPLAWISKGWLEKNSPHTAKFSAYDILKSTKLWSGRSNSWLLS